jgi:hypothetical protein
MGSVDGKNQWLKFPTTVTVSTISIAGSWYVFIYMYFDNRSKQFNTSLGILKNKTGHCIYR